MLFHSTIAHSEIATPKASEESHPLCFREHKMKEGFTEENEPAPDPGRMGIN
jgi:hypothetical protein